MEINFQKFNELTMDDKEFALELLEVYAVQFDEYAADLPQGSLADAETVRFMNHKIKSSVVVLGLSDFLAGQSAFLVRISEEKPADEIRVLREQIINDCRAASRILRKRAGTL